MKDKYEAIQAKTTQMHNTVAEIYEALMDDEKEEALALVTKQIQSLEQLKKSLTK